LLGAARLLEGSAALGGVTVNGGFPVDETLVLRAVRRADAAVIVDVGQFPGDVDVARDDRRVLDHEGFGVGIGRTAGAHVVDDGVGPVDPGTGLRSVRVVLAAGLQARIVLRIAAVSVPAVDDEEGGELRAEDFLGHG